MKNIFEQLENLFKKNAPIGRVNSDEVEKMTDYIRDSKIKYV